MLTINPLNFDYYYGSEAEQFSFYRIPRMLMTEPHFKKLSSDAKILYSLMLDRMSLSMKNDWIDKENRVYIFYTLEDVQENLNCSHTTGVKIFAELDADNGIGLIERVKQGQGRPARIYVKNFVLPVDKPVEKSDNGNQDFKNVDAKTSKNLKSRHQENRSADFQNLAANQTYLNKNNFNDIEYQSIYPPAHAKILPILSQSEKIDMTDMMESYKKIIHENQEYIFQIKYVF